MGAKSHSKSNKVKALLRQAPRSPLEQTVHDYEVNTYETETRREGKNVYSMGEIKNAGIQGSSCPTSRVEECDPWHPMHRQLNTEPESTEADHNRT